MKESKTLEYKQDISNSFLKTVSAYANFGTGVIQFGIADDGTICGIENPEQTCLDIENKINDSILPKPDYSFNIKNNVITLIVEEGHYKPYLYKGKAYRRSDTATIEVDNIELKRLTLEGSNLYFEQLPIKEKDLTFHILENELKEKLGIQSLTDDMLRTFGFFTKNKEFNNVAAIFSDENSFPGIDAARFGNSISEIMDRETFSHISILSQYKKITEFFRRYYQYEKIEGFERIKIELIPEDAFREAIANALVHRTWDMSSYIKVEMYPDRIEVLSPGGLPNDLSKDEYLNGTISNLRNPVIGNMFFRLHYIEMFGTGIRRIKECYSSYSEKPSFEIYDNSIKVLLPVISRGNIVTTDEKKILDIMGNMILSCSEISDKLGWDKNKALREINKLKSKGYLKTIGNGRGTKYGKK